MSDVEDLAAVIKDRSCCKICLGGSRDIAKAILDRNYVIPKRWADTDLAGDGS